MCERPGENYLQPYREAVQAHGPGFHATLWASRESQLKRFDVLINLAGLENCTVLDAGCATGDFAEHLNNRGVNFKRYVGVDAVAELIEAARACHLPRCEFRLADLFHDQSFMREIEPDFVCMSGTLNTMNEEAARQLVQASFDAAAQGIVFNFLSNRAEDHCMQRDIGPARRFDTIKWIDWAICKTPHVSFTQDYLDGHDATILMRRA